MGLRTPNADRRRCDSTGKVCMNKADASRAAKTLNQRQQRDRDPVHPFLCHECGRWHTGHAGPRARNPRLRQQHQRRRR